MGRTNVDVLAAGNYSEVKVVKQASSWSLLRAKSTGAFDDPVNVLFLGSKVAWLTAKDVRQQVNTDDCHVLVWPSSRVAEDLKRVRREFGGKSDAQTVDDFLSHFLRRTFPLKELPLPENPHFVPPTLRLPNGKETPALDGLSAWLCDAGDGTTPRVSVLLAPAGEGKTTLARELDRAITERTAS